VNPVDFQAIAPELILIVAGCVLVLADAFVPRWRGTFGALTAAAAMIAVAARWMGPLPGAVFSDALNIDALARFVDSYVLLAVILVAVLAGPYLTRTGAQVGEFYALLLWAAVGAMVLGSSDHLLTVFVGLELLSICLYVLNAFHRGSLVSLEAGFKYLVVGAFASALLLFGIALVFGATGSFLLPSAGGALAARPVFGDPVLLAGLALIVAGASFKLAVVPFHAWAPDVYQGSPTPVTAFLSVVPKGVMLVLLARVVVHLAPHAATTHWVSLIAILAVLSQTLGNLVAIAQQDIKRMLAYSGIAHMGYALVGLAAYRPGAPAGGEGLTGVLVYLAAYTVMNVAAFAVVSAFSEGEEEQHLIADLAGQGWQRPVLAAVLAIAMFSLAGIPPTVGFIAKFMVFRAAVGQGLTWLAVIGVLNSFISAFFYLRVVFLLYMKPLPKRPPAFTDPWPTRLAAGACAFAVLAFGILPSWLVTAAETAARVFGR